MVVANCLCSTTKSKSSIMGLYGGSCVALSSKLLGTTYWWTAIWHWISFKNKIFMTLITLRPQQNHRSSLRKHFQIHYHDRNICILFPMTPLSSFYLGSTYNNWKEVGTERKPSHCLNQNCLIQYIPYDLHLVPSIFFTWMTISILINIVLV